MKTPKAHPSAILAVLAVAEIKAAVAAFDRGERNVFEVLDAVAAAVAGRPGVVPRHRDRAGGRRRAA